MAETAPAQIKQKDSKRLVILGETPAMPTGFGQQTRLVCEGMVKKGWEVFLLTQAVPMKPIKMTGVEEWRYANIHDVDLMDRVMHALKPDAVFAFGCTGTIAHYCQLRAAPANIPVFYWLPYEGSAVPKEARKMFRGMPRNRVIHLSNFARDMWAGPRSEDDKKPIVESDIVIPHAVDLSLFEHQPDLDRTHARREWSKRLRFPLFDDAVVVINMDRNIWHKRWDATYDFVNRLQEKMPDREVLLIAHSKMIQTQERGHPPGYSLPHLETAYGLQGRVAYTYFDWGNGFEREEIAEMIRLADLRLTTSEGEGFGIPTIETASLGIPQIVNKHTCMSELLPEGSPFLVDPAMMEDNMGSLWAIPDVREMANRAAHLLNNPDETKKHTEAARDFVSDRFEADNVCGQFDELFRRACQRSRDSIWVESRWGFQKQADIDTVFSELGRAISKVQHAPKVLEIGSFTGQFLDKLVEYGIPCSGIEWNEQAINEMSNRSRMYLRHRSPDPNGSEGRWPNADVVVLTDQLELLYSLGGIELVESCFTEACRYPWVFARFRPAYQWGQPLVDPTGCRGMLKQGGLTRRPDLEKAIREHVAKWFEHEIWQRDSDGSIPAGIATAMSEKKD